MTVVADSKVQVISLYIWRTRYAIRMTSTNAQYDTFSMSTAMTEYLQIRFTMILDPYDLLKFQNIMPSMNRQKIMKVPSASYADFYLQQRQYTRMLSIPTTSIKHAVTFIIFWPAALNRQFITVPTTRGTANTHCTMRISPGLSILFYIYILALLTIIYILFASQTHYSAFSSLFLSSIHFRHIPLIQSHRNSKHIILRY